MQFEVEQKFPVDDLPALETRLRQLGGVIHDPQLQVDCYYRHPARDFASTDEALRIRQVGKTCYLTYKGPKLDAQTKTRREIELPLPDHDRPAALLEALGFEPVAEVRKQRRAVELPWQGRTVHAALDQVEGVGQFVELELLADQAGLDSARAALAALAAQLGLQHSERRSYLELLLARSTPDSAAPESPC